MKLKLQASWTLRITLTMALAIGLPAVTLAKGGVSQSTKPAADHEEVELFAAMAAGDIEVELIPKDSTNCTVRFVNKTDKPVAVKLPNAFAGVPVLAQFGGGMGMGGGFLNLAADKVGTVKVATVCLEHGKTDPNPHVKYEMRPIAEFTDNEQTIEICRMLANGEIPQKTAQAAAWNLMDKLSWQELAAKDKVRRSNGYYEKWFSFAELNLAQRAISVAAQRIEARGATQPESPGECYNE